MALPLDARFTPTSALDPDIVSSRLSPEEESAIVDGALKPGNLIWGKSLTTKDQWSYLLRRGIVADTHICFHLIEDYDLPMMRYQGAHYGPSDEEFHFERYPNTVTGVGIILDRNKILSTHSNPLVAVGEDFTEKPKISTGIYRFNDEGTKVYDLPIERISSRPEPFYSEVRLLKGNEPDLAAVGPYYWAGIVVRSIDADALLDWTKTINVPLQIPLFNTEAKLLISSIT